jgi:pilus assembly protein CpaF
VDTDATKLVEEVVAEAIGLGPIEPLLADETVTEVMVNGPDRVYIEREGRLAQAAVRFINERSLMSAIERIVTPLGRRIDEGVPMVDARLADGSRVNAIIPPLSLVGPVITIRKFAKQRFDMQRLIEIGSLSPQMAEFLQICVDQRRNIVISGGTGSGKTTFLNALSDSIPDSERIITIEDAAELRLNQRHVISLEARPANVEGKGHVTIRDLVRNALRMRPDRIIVGECRGGEALDMLQAMNTGHDGSLTTGHANAPRDLLSRLEVMVLMSGMDLPVRAIREQIASAVNIIVQQTRFKDGKRRVTDIVEVDGMEGDVILLQKLFEFRQRGIGPAGEVQGEYVGLECAPRFYNELERAGVGLDRNIFNGTWEFGVGNSSGRNEQCTTPA